MNAAADALISACRAAIVAALLVAVSDAGLRGQERPPAAAEKPQSSPEPALPLAPEVPPGLESEEKVKETLDAVKKELESIQETDPLGEQRKTALGRQLDVLQRHLSLLERRRLSEELHKVVDGKVSIDAAISIADEKLQAERSALEALDPAKHPGVASLGIVENLDELQAGVTRFDEDLAKQRASLEQSSGRLKQLTSEQNGLQGALDVARKELTEMQAGVAALQQAMEGARDRPAAERDLLHRRLDIRKQGVHHYQKLIEYLNTRPNELKKLIDHATRERDIAAVGVQRAEALAAAAHAVLDARLERDARAAQMELERTQREAERAREDWDKIYAQEAVAVQQTEAHHRAHLQELALLDQERTRAEDTLKAARSELANYRTAYARDDKTPSLDEVRKALGRLEQSTSWESYRRAAAASAERLDRLRKAAQATASQSEDLERSFAAKLSEARAAFESRLDERPDLTRTWESELARWNELKTRKAGLLEQERATLERSIARVEETARFRDQLREVERETILLLRRENLFLRGESKIRWAAIVKGFEDLSRLPAFLSDAARDVGACLGMPSNRRPLALALAIFVLGAVVLLSLRAWLTRRVKGLLQEDLQGLPARNALTIAFLLRAVCVSGVLLLAFFLPAGLLGGLSAGVAQLLPVLGVFFALAWFGRAVNRELFKPEPASRAIVPLAPRTARGAWWCITAVIVLSLAFVPLNLALEHLGWENEGALEFLWACYEVLLVIPLLGLLVRRDIVRSFLPSPDRPVAKLLRFVVLTLHLVLLLLVPAVLVLDLFKFDFLAGIITTLSVTVVAVALTGYLLYHGVCYGIARWLRSAVTSEEGDEAARRTRVAAEDLLRFALRFVVIVGGFFLVLLILGVTLTEVRTFLEVALPWEGVTDAEPVTWWNLAVAAFLMTLFLLAARHVKSALSHLILPRTRIDSGVQYAITALVGYVLIGVGAYVSLKQVFDLQNVGYIMAALTVGIGFGLQEVVSNFVSGLILLFERPLKVGDMVRIGDVEGTVHKISIRATTIQSLDNISILVPNKDLITKEVVNFVHGGDSRIRISVPVGIAYGSDTALARKVLYEVADDHGLVLRRPAPEVRFVAFGDSSLNFELLVWIGSARERFRIATDLTFAIDAAFRRHGIVIAFPQRDLHLKSAEPIRVVHQSAEQDGAELDEGADEEPVDDARRKPAASPGSRLP